VATKASVTFPEVNTNLFSTVLECCQKKTEIKYINKIKNHIAGKSVFGGRRNRDGINFQIIFNKGVNGMDVYDYAKRGTDRRLIDSLIEDISPLMGEKMSLKLEDINECGVCKRKLRVGTPRFIPSVGWETLSELCESCYALLSDHDKNYCCVCHKKLRFRKYSAGIEWNGNLQVCKDCYVVNKQRSIGNFNRPTQVGSAFALKEIYDGDFNQKNIRKAMNGSVLVGSDDPLHILKIRLARGEIGKEEYQETRKLLEE
jgi:hypothetical protein